MFIHIELVPQYVCAAKASVFNEGLNFKAGPFAGTSESSDHFLKEFMEEIQPEAKTYWCLAGNEGMIHVHNNYQE